MYNLPACIQTGREDCVQCSIKPSSSYCSLKAQEQVSFDVIVRSISIAKIPNEVEFAWEHLLRRQALKGIYEAVKTRRTVNWVIALGVCANWLDSLEKFIPWLTMETKKRALIRKQLLYNFVKLMSKKFENLHLQCQLSNTEKHYVNFFNSFKD